MNSRSSPSVTPASDGTTSSNRPAHRSHFDKVRMGRVMDRLNRIFTAVIGVAFCFRFSRRLFLFERAACFSNDKASRQRQVLGILADHYGNTPWLDYPFHLGVPNGQVRRRDANGHCL